MALRFVGMEEQRKIWDDIVYCSLTPDVKREYNGLVPKHAQVNFIRGAIPNQFTYPMVFNACSRLGDCGIVQPAHVRVIVNGMPADLPLQNSLLDIYCSCLRCIAKNKDLL